MAEGKGTGELIRSTSKESIISAISHVGDWEIGDRCQIGGRAGNIVYIGPTRFAPGEWIGIVLDQPLGKNDGSVDGYRYFSCEPNHGLFCKASKLEHVESPSSSNEVQQINPFCKEYGMEIGDRVIVSGGKYGRLRFLGNTDFKDGVWAGIELDQPVGKNDGSVQGKRYFTCKAPYGLFAAASKVIRAPEQTSAKFKIRHTKTSALRQRSGSHESLSSIGASSIASSRISKYNFATPRSVQRPTIISSSRGQEDLFKTIKDSLKEKETHLEQMIRERDLERNEMAALSNRCELAEAKAAQLEVAKSAVDQQLEALKIRLDETKAKFKVADDAINDLTVQLKEKKDALDDLTFRYDEEVIMNAEMAEKIADLEKRVAAKELMQLVSPDDAGRYMDENEAEMMTDNEDLSMQLETVLNKLNSLMDYHKTVKKAVQERLEKDKEEINSLATQVQGFKTMDDKEVMISNKDKELSICHSTMEQLKSELEKVEDDKAKLKEIYDALEISSNALKEDFDCLKKRNAELNEKMENEKEGHSMEIVRLKEELQKAQNDIMQLQEQLNEVEVEKTKLAELQQFLEDSNKKLLTDSASLESQKVILEGKLKQMESEKESLNSSLTEKETELASTKSKIDELTGQVDRLRVNLCEASSSDESLKKELESIREESKKEAEDHGLLRAQLQTTNESLEKDLLATKRDFQSLENSHNDMKSALEKTESELQLLKEKFSAAEQEIIDEQEKVTKLQQEIVSHISNAEHLQKIKEEEAAKHAEIQLRQELTCIFHTQVSERYDALKQSLKGRISLDSDYREKVRKLGTELESISKRLSTVDCKGESLEETVGNLLKERVHLMEAEKGLKTEIEKLTVEKEKQTSDLALIVEKFSQLEKERHTLAASLNKMENELREANESLVVVQNDKTFLVSEIAALKEVTANVNKKNDESSIILSSLAEEKSELEQRISRLEKERNDKVVELDVLKAEMTSIAEENKNKDNILNSLQAEITKSNEENDALRMTVSKLMADLSVFSEKSGNSDGFMEKESIVNNREDAQNELYEKEIHALREEKDQAISQINSLKLEITELSKKQAEDEETISEARQRNTLFIDFEEEWKSKEAAYMQKIEELKVAAGKTETEKIEEMKRDISFLNSIIAEQYKKEKDLKEQIAILNSLPAKEILKELEHKTTREVPPRLYCDICEIFDLHDTTDCPTQAMDTMGEKNDEKSRKVKPPPRPYCDQCEEFGHDLSNCPEVQTAKPKSKDYTF
uniref:CAP-Gly domain-containing protein n=1 Tax=Setaria digitata TaxID=48799 RepID=A0A915Q4V6_9BILA